MEIIDQDLARLQALFWDSQRTKQPPLQNLGLAKVMAVLVKFLKEYDGDCRLVGEALETRMLAAKASQS